MSIARWLVKLARVAAPGDRVEWVEAMLAEFDALDGDGSRLAWSAGCLRTVMGWRLQAYAPYLVLLMVLPVVWNVVISQLIFTVSTNYAFSQHMSQREMGGLWMSVDGVGDQATLFLLAAALCAFKPRRALVSTGVLWLTTTGAAFLAMFGPHFSALLAHAPFSSQNNHPALPNIVMALAFAGGDMWPVVVGGFAGWALARGKHVASAASFAVAFTLVAGFAAFFLNISHTDAFQEIDTALFTLIATAFIGVIMMASAGAARDLLRAWNTLA